MNILSAMYAGQLGFLKAGQSLAEKANRVSQIGYDTSAQESLGEDLVGMEIDKATVRANLQSIRVSDAIFSELVNNFGDSDKS